MAITVQPPLGPRGHRSFFGDAERTFELTAPMVIELERVTNTGIGALFRRLINSDFKQGEIADTIRLALIGGGETPERAAELVQTYVMQRPLTESYALAVTILESLWFGPSKDKGDANE